MTDRSDAMTPPGPTGTRRETLDDYETSYYKLLGNIGLLWMGKLIDADAPRVLKELAEEVAALRDRAPATGTEALDRETLETILSDYLPDKTARHAAAYSVWLALRAVSRFADNVSRLRAAPKPARTQALEEAREILNARIWPLKNRGADICDECQPMEDGSNHSCARCYYSPELHVIKAALTRLASAEGGGQAPEAPVCPYCKEAHDARVACPAYHEFQNFRYFLASCKAEFEKQPATQAQVLAYLRAKHATDDVIAHVRLLENPEQAVKDMLAKVLPRRKADPFYATVCTCDPNSVDPSCMEHGAKGSVDGDQ